MRWQGSGRQPHSVIKSLNHKPDSTDQAEQEQTHALRSLRHVGDHGLSTGHLDGAPAPPADARIGGEILLHCHAYVG